jgi:N-acetylglucosamine kinase-like BadF-type ATPase
VSLVLAIDGGNSKTDVALIRGDGALLGLARGTGSSPHHLGGDRSLDVIDALVAQLAPPESPQLALLLMAGVDFPEEEHELEELVAQRGWAKRIAVRNDTFAVLRAGTDRGWGIAVTCGAGINCVGVAPDGRHHRFPALGPNTGDWGGGQDVGQEALYAAARSEDGRGPRTRLERDVSEHFGVANPAEVAYQMHRGRLDQGRLVELAPIVFAAAADDAVAAEIVARLVVEVVALVRVTAQQLGLEESELDVVLGGGLLQDADDALVGEISRGVHATAPLAVVRPTAAPAVLGSALLALDELGADDDAKARLRREFEGRTSPVTIGGLDG